MLFEENKIKEYFPDFPGIIQTNLVWSFRGALRGFHGAKSDAKHWKILTCIDGTVCDALLDLRSNSRTFGEIRICDFNSKKGAVLIIPPGFAHAVQGISAKSLIVYGTNVEFKDNQEFEINPLSPEFEISWKEPIILSNRDSLAPNLSDWLKSRKEL